MPTSRLLLSLALAAALAACRGERAVTVRVLIPGADGRPTPAVGVAVAALPYDRDSVIAAMEAKAGPKPPTALLDSLHAAFREPFTAFAAASLEVTALRDSLALALRRRDQVEEHDSLYPVRTADVTRLDAAVLAAEARRGEARKRLDAARRAFGPEADSARAAIRAWENSTYRGYEEITTGLTRLRPALSDTTGADGTVTLVLRDDPWWLYASSWDAGDPNGYWYWNIRVEGDTVVLDAANARHKPRY